MEIRRFAVKGPEFEQLATVLEQELKYIYVQRRDGYCLFANEEHYFRTNSMLMSMVVVSRLDTLKHEVVILSGGSGTGFLGLDWGAANSGSKKLIELIRKLCRQHEWLFSKVTVLYSE